MIATIAQPIQVGHEGKIFYFDNIPGFGKQYSTSVLATLKTDMESMPTNLNTNTDGAKLYNSTISNEMKSDLKKERNTIENTKFNDDQTTTMSNTIMQNLHTENLMEVAKKRNQN